MSKAPSFRLLPSNFYTNYYYYSIIHEYWLKCSCFCTYILDK